MLVVVRCHSWLRRVSIKRGFLVARRFQCGKGSNTHAKERKSTVSSNNRSHWKSDMSASPPWTFHSEIHYNFCCCWIFCNRVFHVFSSLFFHSIEFLSLPYKCFPYNLTSQIRDQHHTKWHDRNKRQKLVFCTIQKATKNPARDANKKNNGNCPPETPTHA